MNSPLQGKGSLVRVDAVGGDFDFGNATEGEQKLYEVYGWLFRGLFDNVTNSVGDRGLEHHTLGLQASKVHTHELARLEHHSCPTKDPPAARDQMQAVSDGGDALSRYWAMRIPGHPDKLLHLCNHSSGMAWHAGSLNAFRPRASRRRRRPRGDVLVGFLLCAPVDFDRTFEVRAVFDHDLCRRQIPDHRTVLPDLDPSLRAHVPLHVAVHHHVAGVDVSRYLRRRSDRQLPLIKLDQSFDRAVDQQILGAGDVALHMQARPQPPRRAVRCRIQWTHRICARFVRQQIFRFRDRSLRRIQFLLIPHRTLLGTAHPTQISRRSASNSSPRSSLQKFPARFSVAENPTPASRAHQCAGCWAAFRKHLFVGNHNPRTFAVLKSETYNHLGIGVLGQPIKSSYTFNSQAAMSVDSGGTIVKSSIPCGISTVLPVGSESLESKICWRGLLRRG